MDFDRLARNAVPGGRGVLATLLVFAVCLVLFALAGQRTLHGMDSDYFIVWLESGNRDYPRHFAYLHWCGLVYELIRPLGGSAFRALLLGSALGSALGLASLYRAGRLLGGEGGRWLWLAVLSSPAWLYFATCAEIPGVFAGGVGLSWWAFAGWRARQIQGHAALVGAATGLTGALHTFGHLLPLVLVLAAAVLGVRLERRHALQLAAAAVAHAAVVLALAWLLGPGASGQARDALAHLEERWATLSPDTAPQVSWREWVLPFLPWSLLGLGALLAPRARAFGLITACGLLLHLPLCVLLLGHYGIDEQGAYLLALLPPAALASLQLVPRRWHAVPMLAGAALAVANLAPHWRDPAPPAFAQGVAELRAERPFLLVVGNRGELDGARTAVADLLCVDAGRALGEFLYEQARGTTIEQWFDGWIARMEGLGAPVLLSDSARRLFENGPGPPLAGFWARHVAVRYRLLPEERQGFRGTWVRPQ